MSPETILADAPPLAPSSDSALRCGGAIESGTLSRELPVPRGAIVVEVADAGQLIGLDRDWLDLLGRAVTPNVFMDPALLGATALSYPKWQCVTLLAWQQSADSRRLVGVWGFALRRAAHSILPIRVLAAQAMPHGYLATPVVDRAVFGEVLAAMLDRIAGDPNLPNVLSLENLGADHDTIDALNRVLGKRGSRACVFQRWLRPRLPAAANEPRLLERTLSSATRKKLRQHRRRLAGQGTLEYRIAREPGAVGEALDAFMRMEASGWKGRRGTALLDDAQDSAFARAMAAALAGRGAIAVHGLYLDGRAVSLQVVLHAGAAAYTWKTAYDESLQDFSPGMLLFEDYTADFLADERVEFVDSCAIDDTGFMAAWTERQPVAAMWIDARRGNLAGFAIMALLQKSYLRLRRTVKALYQRSQQGIAQYRRALGRVTKGLTA